MENMEDYANYWDAQKLFYDEELDSFGIDEDNIPSYDSSSPEITPSSSSTAALPKNIIMERNRRELVKSKLYSLRSVVPKITKMDKASIIKDAIDYIQSLQEQEKKLAAEIFELEQITNVDKMSTGDITQDDDDDAELLNERRKKKRTTLKTPLSAPVSFGSSSINEAMELKVWPVGERTLVVTISCSRKGDIMIKVCELFESLNVKVITANISSVSRSLLHTLIVESDEMNSTQLKEMMEGAIAERDHIMTSMSF